MKILNVKYLLDNSIIYELLTPSVYNPTLERLLNRAKKYQQDDSAKVYACRDNNEYKGIIVFEIKGIEATILDIAVKLEERGKSIGSELIDFVFNQFGVSKIIAETDDDAIGFYKKYGFVVEQTKIEFDTKRYVCLCDSVAHHYDLLIDQNNDPVYDPEPLRNYMDKWDGKGFIDKMELSKEKSVLEIGVGTGRLAVRTAPKCGEFTGIDISPKTVNRAKENLADYKNVTLICGDFLKFDFKGKFDVIYSSLTFMHIEEKQKAIEKAAELLNMGGRFVLSTDKNQDTIIDCGTNKITVYPDCPCDIKKYIELSGLKILEKYETEFAHIFVAGKNL